MIEARALVSINFLNLSENYDFMSRWLGVYDKYAKLLKGSSDAVVKDGSGTVSYTHLRAHDKHLALQAILAEYGQKLNKSHLYSETVGLSEAHDIRRKCFSALQMNIKSKRYRNKRRSRCCKKPY